MSVLKTSLYCFTVEREREMHCFIVEIERAQLSSENRLYGNKDCIRKIACSGDGVINLFISITRVAKKLRVLPVRKVCKMDSQ